MIVSNWLITALRILFVAGLWSLLPCSLSAQSKKPLASADLPVSQYPELAELPVLRKEIGNAKLINSENASEFKNIILPEFYRYVRGGAIEMSAVRELFYDWQMDLDWLDNSQKSEMQIAEDGGLTANLKWDRGFPFGSRMVLDQEVDQKLLARKILWNMFSNFWSQKYISFNFLLRALGQGEVERRFTGSFSRAFISSLEEDNKTGQLFRELVKIETPAALKHFSYLSFRFFGGNEDFLWIYSPVIGKTRQLTGANRSDGILGSSLALNDFLSWSAKPQTVDAEVNQTLVALVPFISLKLSQAVPVSLQCVGVKDTAGEEAQERELVNWSYESEYPPQEAPWLPRGVVYVPRELWRIQLIQKDRYSLYGRQILYVDRQSMLPVYLFVYDGAGSHWKTLIVVSGLAENPDHTRRYPFNSFMIINDLKTNQVYLLDYLNIRYCDQYPQETTSSDFDPGKLKPQPNKRESQEKQPAEKPKETEGAEETT